MPMTIDPRHELPQDANALAVIAAGLASRDLERWQSAGEQQMRLEEHEQA